MHAPENPSGNDAVCADRRIDRSTNDTAIYREERQIKQPRRAVGSGVSSEMAQRSNGVTSVPRSILSRSYKMYKKTFTDFVRVCVCVEGRGGGGGRGPQAQRLTYLRLDGASRFLIISRTVQLFCCDSTPLWCLALSNGRVTGNACSFYWPVSGLSVRLPSLLALLRK